MGAAPTWDLAISVTLMLMQTQMLTVNGLIDLHRIHTESLTLALTVNRP